MRSLPLICPLLCLAPLLGCPTPSTPDAGPAEDAGPDPIAAPDAGPVDAGTDAGFLDAGLDAGTDAGTDAGPVCAFPPIPQPDGGGPDAGEDCTLQSTEGTGHFEGTWDGRVWGELALAGAFDLPATGELAFDVYCGGDKLLVSGALEGEAMAPDAGPNAPVFPFSGPLWGEFDLATGEVEMIVQPATLVIGPFSGTFRVSMGGVRANDSFEDGVWCGDSLNPTGAFGEGTWTAELR